MDEDDIENGGTATAEASAEPKGDAGNNGEAAAGSDDVLNTEVPYQGGTIKVGKLLDSQKISNDEISKRAKENADLRNENGDVRRQLETLQRANETFEQMFNDPVYGPRIKKLTDQFLKNDESGLIDEDEEKDLPDDPHLRKALIEARSAKRETAKIREDARFTEIQAQVHDERMFIEKEEKQDLLLGKTPDEKYRWFSNLLREAKERGRTMKDHYLIEYQDQRLNRRVKTSLSAKDKETKTAAATLGGAAGNGARQTPKPPVAKTRDERRKRAVDRMKEVFGPD
jgi:hypothetical protein